MSACLDQDMYSGSTRKGKKYYVIELGEYEGEEEMWVADSEGEEEFMPLIIFLYIYIYI